MEEKELFEDYEMRSWELTPRIYKILGIAATVNFLILFAFGQFNLFSTRGCDAPYVGIVCQVLDSAYVASTFLGQNNEWESRPYTKNELADADITYIDVSDRLEYPAGYFALANPEQMSTTDVNSPSTLTDPLAPIPGDTGNSLDTKPQVIPTPNDSVGKQNAPDSPFEFGDKPSKTKTPPVKVKTPAKNPILGESPKTLPKNNTVATASPKPTPSPTPTDADANKAKDDFNNAFNKKPLQDFADGVIAKIDSPKPEDKIDLKQPFTVVLNGTLTKEGKFDPDPKKTGFVKGEGNEKMVNVVKSAIEAMGDSAIFGYLQRLGVDKVNITLVQDDKQISAVITSALPSNESARTIYSGFNGLIVLANMNTKDDKEVQALLKATQFKADGKNFIINFAMPKEDAHKMIDQKLQEARQKKSQPNNGDGVKESANAQGK